MLVVLGLIGAFLAHGYADDHGRVWRAILFNWLFWSSLAMGMVMLAVAFHLTNAQWAWSIRRFALGGVAFLPMSLILLVPVFFGSEHYFHHWLHVEGDPVIDAKRAWLSLPGMIARDFIGLLILYGLSIAFAYRSLRPDVYGAGRDDHQRSWYKRLTAKNWLGVTEEAALSRRKMNVLGVVLGVAYAVIWGMIGIDLAMTLLPHWFSTMFPVAFFMAAFHAGICGMVILVTVFRRRLGLEEYITVRQYHDMGKLVFAFAVFWMYLNWSQYVVIWYGLLPHEQEWFVLRFNAPFTRLSQAVPLLIFVIPFFGLLTRPPKKVPAILATFAGIILIGNWIERFMIVTPSIYEGKTLPFGIPEVLVGLGFMGLFLACYLWFIRTFPVLPSPVSLAAMGSPIVTLPAPTTATATAIHR